MTNLVTGLIGIALWVAFVGFILVWLKALPLIIICCVVFALLVHDFIRTIRHGYSG